MVKPNMSRAESAGTSNHPLVSMLFWLVGKKSGDEDEEAEETHSRHSKSFDGHEMGDDVGDHSGGDRGSGSDGGRTLSWRDERSDEAIAVWHEFLEVKAADIPLQDHCRSNNNSVDTNTNTNNNTTPKGSLKSGTVLGRRQQNSIDDGEHEEQKRRSPNSNEWGYFVSITPPSDLYPKEEQHKDEQLKHKKKQLQQQQQSTDKAKAIAYASTVSAPSVNAAASTSAE